MTTHPATLLAGATAAALFSISGIAAAQDTSAEPDMGGSGYFAEEVASPRRALELTLGAGYTQGFGRLEEGAPVGDTSNAGMSFELGAAYRLSPRWSIGVTGGYQTFQAGDDLIDDAGPDGATARL